MEQKQFIEKIGGLARADMEKSGILASLTTAQAILESAWGTSELAVNANALFGIKADSRWAGKVYSKDTKECYDGANYTTITALFRAYGSWEESVADHSAFLLAATRYAAVVGERDYKTACKAIKAAGYATAPDYAEKLVALIEKYKLYEYDIAEGKEQSTMSESPLVTYTNLTKNRTSPRNHAIDTITIHCYVGQVTAKQGCDFFATTPREVSANYVVGKDGSIGQSVSEKDRSWCSGGKDANGNPIRVNGISGSDNDHRAITIEVASDTTHPYAVTAAAYAALIDLVTDICKRNGIKKLLWQGNKSLVGQVDKQNMTVHRWFANKACPGDYLYNKHAEIAAEVNKRLGSAGDDQENAATSNPPADTTAGFPAVPFTVKVIVSDLNIRSQPSMSGAIKGQTGKGVFTIVEVQNGWGKLKSGAGWIYLENPEYCTVNGVAAAPAPAPAVPYTVKVSVSDLNIRKGPGTNYAVAQVCPKGVYTIVQESQGTGASAWGKLKSGAGWISLDYVKKV